MTFSFLTFKRVLPGHPVPWIRLLLFQNAGRRYFSRKANHRLTVDAFPWRPCFLEAGRSRHTADDNHSLLSFINPRLTVETKILRLMGDDHQCSLREMNLQITVDRITVGRMTVIRITAVRIIVVHHSAKLPWTETDLLVLVARRRWDTFSGRQIATTTRLLTIVSMTSQVADVNMSGSN